MSKLEIRELIRASIVEEELNKREEFRTLGSGKKRYTEEQKEYAINKAQEIGVRATARLLQLPRKTIQRWLRAKGARVKRCPDWVYDWAYWRITQDEYDKKARELKEKQYKLTEKLKSLTEGDENYSMTLISLLNICSKAPKLFESSKVEQKKTTY